MKNRCLLLLTEAQLCWTTETMDTKNGWTKIVWSMEEEIYLKNGFCGSLQRGCLGEPLKEGEIWHEKGYAHPPSFLVEPLTPTIVPSCRATVGRKGIVNEKARSPLLMRGLNPPVSLMNVLGKNFVQGGAGNESGWTSIKRYTYVAAL